VSGARTIVAALTLISFPVGSIVPAAAGNNYAVGQVWEYDARKEDAGSLLRVMQIDDVPGVGQIIHICVVGLKLPYPAGQGGVLTEVPEIPMKPAAMDASVRKRSNRHAASQRFGDAYAAWQQDAETGQVATVRIPLKEMMARIAAQAKQSTTP